MIKLGIRTKFLLVITLLLFLIFGGITVYLIRTSTSSLRQDLRDESEAFASLATPPIGNVFAIYRNSGTSRIDQQVETFAELNDSVTEISIVDNEGNVVFQSSDQSPMAVTAEQAQSFEPIYLNNDSGALETIIFPYFEASGSHRFSIVYSISDEAVEQAVRRDAMSIIYFGGIALAVTLVLTYLLINKLIINPIQEVSEQASAISAGSLDRQITVRGQDEIASLGRSVNKMADSLKADIIKLKEVDKVKSEFMIITSHNLRTPLTIITGYLDNMDEFNNPTMVKNALGKIRASAKRLDVFAEDILTISQFELGNFSLTTEPIVITTFFKRLAEEFKPSAELKSIHVITDIPDLDVKAKISEPHLRSAIWNILDNAVKFTPHDGTIRLDVSQSAYNIHFAVSDTGIGISASELPKLFTKFHRGTSTMKYDYEGTGIGLYATKMIIERMGGTVAVESVEGKGSTFSVSLPII